jgi:hypothetical protein
LDCLSQDLVGTVFVVGKASTHKPLRVPLGDALADGSAFDAMLNAAENLASRHGGCNPFGHKLSHADNECKIAI